LEAFLSWLIANGVQGIGQGDSAVGLYEGKDGERGLLSLKPIKRGEVLLVVPLRLALTDFPEDEESNKLLYEDAPWSVRLSAKLLRQVTQGRQSPWYPYLQVLPPHVPCPLETFAWEEMQDIQYLPAQGALFEHDWLVTDAYSRCSPEAVGAAGQEQFKWAMSVVHSRTFGNASRQGGVGVRMLVPLVDMLNHGGDETLTGMPTGEQVAADNVRWDVVPEGSSWAMVVSATQDVEEGCQLLLSYGERPSDDFFLHYGFVPPGNPHEDVQLFEGLEAALQWHFEEYGSQLPQDKADEVYSSALQAGLQELHNEQEQLRQQLQQQREQQGLQGMSSQQGAQQLAADSEDSSGDSELKLFAGSRISRALAVAFGAVVGGDTRKVELAVARRCWELLHGMGTHMLYDLAGLVVDAQLQQQEGQEQAETSEQQVLVHYARQLEAAGLSPLEQNLAQVCGSGAPSSSQALALAQHILQDLEPATSAQGEAPLLDTAAGGAAADLLDAIGVHHALQDVQAISSLGGSEGQSGGAGSKLVLPLSATQKLLVQFRLAKKMVLWDAVLKARASRADLG